MRLFKRCDARRTLEDSAAQNGGFVPGPSRIGTSALSASIQLLLLVAWGIAMEGTSLAQSQGEFDFIFPIASVADYPPEEMIANCGGTYDDATATAVFRVEEDSSRVIIELNGGVPNMLYTAWLRLGTGGSPLTGAGSTPLASPSFIEALAASTPSRNLTSTALAAGLLGDDGTGSIAVQNGFVTNANGDGTLLANLSFSLADEIYPFTEFDQRIPDMPLGDNPFAIRLVSHCVDGVGHGLVAGTREAWFDLSAIVVPEPNDSVLLAMAFCAFVAFRHKRLERCRQVVKRSENPRG